MAHFPSWLHVLAIVSLAIAVTCAVVIALDELRRPQKMRIMYAVWPLTALFGSVLWLGAYYRWGRGPADGDFDEQPEAPFPAMVLKGASHCGAGCTLGDIVAEWAAFAGRRSRCGSATVAYSGTRSSRSGFPISSSPSCSASCSSISRSSRCVTCRSARASGRRRKPTSPRSVRWQIGMYGLMAVIQFLVFRPAFGGTAEVNTPEFWFAMQAAMIAGFCTAYQVNWLLIRGGVKEKM